MEDAIRNIGLQSIIDKLRPVSDNFLEQGKYLTRIRAAMICRYDL